jgi:nuclear factor of kappa light polypeptide gene enhancer in B-cells 2
MNALADRTSKALLKFARTRSLREFFKTQRFLLSSQDEDGNTPIHLSVLYGNLDMLAIFTDVAATISFQNIINIKNNNQLTALMIAAYLGEVEVCEFLLEANADLTVTDLYGCNVVHVACKNKNIDLLKVIIKYVNKNNCYSVLNTINHDGCAPIHLAVLSESTDILSELLYNGRHLKINIPDKKSGYTALHYAAMRAKLTPIVNLLVKNEDIDINAKSYIGCTPLHIAVANKNYMSTICLVIIIKYFLKTLKFCC